METAARTKVMLLDDEHFLLDIYRIVFERSGFDVTVFDSADAALVALRAGYEPDIVLFDITMPGVSGYEFLEIVKREGLAPQAMKIALTNEAQEGEKQRIIELGADAHMIKALYAPSQLANMVTEMFAKWKSERAAA